MCMNPVGDGAKRVLAGESGSFPSRATALLFGDEETKVLLNRGMPGLDCRAIDRHDRHGGLYHAFTRDIVTML